MCGKILPARNLFVFSFLGLCHMPSMKLRDPCVQIPSAQPPSAATASHKLGPSHCSSQHAHAPHMGLPCPSWGACPKTHRTTGSRQQQVVPPHHPPQTGWQWPCPVAWGLRPASHCSVVFAGCLWPAQPAVTGWQRIPTVSPPATNHSKVSPNQGSTPGMRLHEQGMGGDGVM